MMLEFCAGGSVYAIMQELGRPLSEQQIAAVTRGACSALEFLHSELVIHRDLKSGNILLTEDGYVKLGGCLSFYLSPAQSIISWSISADFGVSARMKSRNERRDTFIGTPYW